MVPADVRRQYGDELWGAAKAVLKEHCKGEPPEVQAIFNRILDEPATDRDVKDVIDEKQRKLIADSDRNYRKQRAAKPTKTKRDMEIVRLHDEEGWSFGQIARKLMAEDPVLRKDRSKWSPKEVKNWTDKVEKGYHRMKERLAARDMEIVRLHDEEGRSFGDIARKLMAEDPDLPKDPSKWPPNALKDWEGEVEKGYHRGKKRLAANEQGNV
jgi:hypothetical protein